MTALNIRYTLRTFRSRPLFAVIAAGTLGLGIGAVTIMFSLVDGVLLRKMPYEQPGELVTIWKTFPQWQSNEVLGKLWDTIGLTWPEFLALRENTHAFRDIAANKNRTMILSGLETPERLEAGEVSSSLFPMLGAHPFIGRTFQHGEEGPGAARVAVLSHSLWISRFGSDPDILGKTITLDQEPFEVIGVMPPGFRVWSTAFNRLNPTLDTGIRALWIPIGFDGLEAGWSFEVMGRLEPGATVEQAQSELDTFVRGEETSEELSFRLTHPKEEITGGHRSSLLLLLVASGILLLIACANIAALFMSETVDRRHEMATRMALGAGRARIVWQVLTESMFIGILGSVLGVIIAAWGISGFLALNPPLPRLEGVGVNFSALLFSILSGVGTGCLAGLIPALLIQRKALRSAQGMGSRSGNRDRGYVQRGLIVVELALTTLMLITSGLFARSLVNLARVDPGFNADSVVTVRAHVPFHMLPNPENIQDIFGQVLDRIRAIPGVRKVGGVNRLPFPGRASGTQIQIERSPSEEHITAHIQDHLMLPGYLETMGIPLLAGRTLTEADARVPRGALINEEMARQYWPDGSPLGTHFQLSRRTYEIVGIVGNVRKRHLSETPVSMIYRAGPLFAQTMCIVVKAEHTPEELLPLMRRAIWAVNSDLPLSQARTVSSLVKDSTGSERYRTMVVLFFGVLAALLACVGVLGTTAHFVSKQRREMSIRAALGAQNGRLVREVVRETTLPALLGIAVGFSGALAVARVLAGFLFGVEAWDAPTYTAITLFLVSLSAGAATLPALRVRRVNLMHVLKEE